MDRARASGAPQRSGIIAFDAVWIVAYIVETVLYLEK
jgi:hypothetical protein